MRFRPRFSIRTLAIVVTLVCAYFGALGATRKHIDEMKSAPNFDETGATQCKENDGFFVEDARSPVPFLISQDEIDYNLTANHYRTRYYVWLLGPTIKLPFESIRKPPEKQGTFGGPGF